MTRHDRGFRHPHAYLSAPDKLRRQFNQAFFERLLIDDTYTVTGHLAQPFDALLGEEVRQYVARRAEAELIDAINDVYQSADEDGSTVPELVLSGAATTTVHVAQGLKEKTMVEVMGLEPTASSMRPKRSSQLSYTPAGTLRLARSP